MLLLAVGVGHVSESVACLKDPFPPAGLSHPDIIEREVPSLDATCCVMTG